MCNKRKEKTRRRQKTEMVEIFDERLGECVRNSKRIYDVTSPDIGTENSTVGRRLDIGTKK